jgi:hypothetical protein
MPGAKTYRFRTFALPFGQGFDGMARNRGKVFPARAVFSGELEMNLQACAVSLPSVPGKEGRE